MEKFWRVYKLVVEEGEEDNNYTIKWILESETGIDEGKIWTKVVLFYELNRIAAGFTSF